MWIVILLLSILLLYGVWKLLRRIYIKPILDKIDTAYNHLLAITMNLMRVESKNYGAKIIRYEEKYKILKKLNEYLLNSKCWIQNYLMTTEERNRYEQVFKDFVNAEKELMMYHLLEAIGANNEIICSGWLNDWYNSIR